MSTTPPPPSDPDQPSGQPYGQAPGGQPGYPPAPGGQPPYGQPPYGAPPASSQGGSGMAIAALVLAFIPLCLTQIVSVVLALVVLIGKRAGRTLAIVALVVNVLAAGLIVVLITAGAILGGEAINDLEDGQCFTANGLGEGDVGSIRVVDCGEPHDGEVLATADLDAAEAEAYVDQSAEDACNPLLADVALGDVPANVSLLALTESAEPSAGDQLVCVAFTTDDEQRDEPLV